MRFILALIGMVLLVSVDWRIAVGVFLFTTRRYAA